MIARTPAGVSAVVVITRDLARRFRAVAATCAAGRRRGPAPPVVARASGDTVTLTARFDGVTLGVTTPAPPGPAGVLVAPMAVLEAVEGAGAGPVELRVSGGHSGEARWVDAGTPRSLPFEAPSPGRPDDPPPDPAEWHPVPPRLLAALHECGRTAARDPGRYALHRVQVRGGAGAVVGTDGRTALVAGGFEFPFGEDLLVPAVPAFGCRELAGTAAVHVGRAGGHLAVRAGPWTVWLPADAGGRYPDLDGVVPRAGAGAVAGLDAADAAAVLAALPGLPGADGEGRPVTLDLDGGVAVRARGPDGVAELRLSRSPAAGPPARVAVDRAALRRALRLGCHTVRTAGGGRPVAFEGAGLTLVTVALDPDAAVAPDPAARVTHTDPAAHGPVHPRPERRTTMPPPDTTGVPGPGRADPPPAEAPDPLAEAEALRAALAEAAARAGRLVAALKHRRREQKALTQAWSSLRALNLTPDRP
ncbi:hypothetical protein [Urbifossiella limnaea]|uniref:Uncharacterized protein n=1 Tax=Urbifossiella limnaea TaxID=2528023 RepID=A0A517XN87_9BACT|nr:hypothetical protein [Urbifossiella limnaea]QDU18969.1 hypothetical protein ETAA1_08690 [Urbifossiella limnaea]